MVMSVVEHPHIEREKAPASGADRGFTERIAALTIPQNDTDAATVDAANPHTSYPVAGGSTSNHVRPYMPLRQPKQTVGHRPDHSNILRYSACRDTDWYWWSRSCPR